MAHNINDNHTLYYHIDAVRSTAYNYFFNPDYLVIKSWTHATLLFLDKIIPTELLEFKYENFFPGVVGYSLYRLPCHHIVAVSQHRSLLVATTYTAV